MKSFFPRNEGEVKALYGDRLQKLLRPLEIPHYSPIENMKKDLPPYDYQDFYPLARELVEKTFKSKYGEALALMTSFTLFFVKCYYDKNKKIPSTEPSLQDLLHFRQMEADLTLKKINNDTLFVIINLPPGVGKSAMSSLFVPWAYLREMRSNFVYLGGSEDILTTAFSSMHETVIQFASKLTTLKFQQEAKADKVLVVKQESGGNDGKIYGYTPTSGFTGQDGNATSIYHPTSPITRPNAVFTDKVRDKSGKVRVLHYQKHFSGLVSIDDPNAAHASPNVLHQTALALSSSVASRLRDTSTSHVTLIQQMLGPSDVPHYFMKTLTGKSVMRYRVGLINRFGFSNFEERKPTKVARVSWKNAIDVDDLGKKAVFFYQEQQYYGDLPGLSTTLQLGQQDFIEQAFGLGINIKKYPIIKKVIVLDPAGLAGKGQDKPCIAIFSIIDYSTYRSTDIKRTQHRVVLEKIIYKSLQPRELEARVVREYINIVRQGYDVSIVIEGGNITGGTVRYGIETDISSQLNKPLITKKYSDVKDATNTLDDADIIEFSSQSIKNVGTDASDEKNYAKSLRFQMAFDTLFLPEHYAQVDTPPDAPQTNVTVPVFYGIIDEQIEVDDFNPQYTTNHEFYGVTRENQRFTPLALLLKQLEELKNRKRPDDFVDVLSMMGIVYTKMLKFRPTEEEVGEHKRSFGAMWSSYNRGY